MSNWMDTGRMSARQMLDIPPFWLLGCLALVWVQARMMPDWTYSFWGARMVGGALIIGGIAVMFWAIATFRAHQTSVVPHQTPSRLITNGPFARSRNPIYLGDVMVLVGAVLWFGAWPMAVLIPCFIWILLRRFIAPEEARMKESFGAEFEGFMKKTPRWL